MALQKHKLEIFINGEKLSYSLSKEDVELYEIAEELINTKINEFNSRPESKNATRTQFLKPIMV